MRYYSSTCKTCSEGYEVENGICKPKNCSNYPSVSDSITGCARTSDCQSALQITYKCEECNAQGWESDGNGGCKPKTCDDNEFPYVTSPTICKGVPLSCPTGDEIHYGCADCNPGYIQDEGYCVETGGGSWEGCELALMPEIFDGKGNTQKIVAQLGNEALAAYACTQFYAPGVSASDPTFGQGKWYLLSIGELMEVYGYNPASVTSGGGSSGAIGTNKTIINNALTTLAGKGVDVAALTIGYYWSSCESSNSASRNLNMKNGYRSTLSKNYYYYVRSFLLLENCFTPLTLSAPQVGDVMYADKSWGAASDYSGSKVAVGVITYVSPTSGYVVIMSLKDLKFRSDGTTVGNFNPATPYTGSSITTGWSTSSTDITALTNYDANRLNSAIKYSTRPECTGVSGGGKNSISFEVTTTKDGMEFTVEMGVKEGTAIIDWGDGNTEKVEKDGSYSHAYKSSGKYTVVITGEATAFAITKGQDYVTKLLDISLASITSYDAAFRGCGYMTGDLSTMTFPSGLTKGTEMFRGCRGLTGSIPELPSGLTNGDAMFSGCSGLTGNVPELPSSLTSGDNMFLGCSGLSGTSPRYRVA